VTSEFFANLAQYRAENKIEDVHFASYKFTDDRGVTEVMPATVPVTYTGFTGFLDKRRNLARFEGIWSDHGGRNVLGIIADRSNPLFNYKAFVISSKEPNWKPGDVKIKFNRLRPRRPTVSQFWASDKRESGVTWRADEEYIVSLNSVDEPRRRGQIALVKTYPTGRKGATTGVGTGWAVTGDGIFATNYHVIEDADTIWVGFRGRNEQKARVIAVDKRVDLALIKIENPNRSYRPLPLSTGPASNGSAVTVIGYPLAFELGDDPRVTNGLISAQKGIGGDITRYQISAAVQRGNSGGPVLNNRAEVVGVVVQRFFAEAENVNFAVKVPYLKLLLESAGIEYARGRSDGTRSPKELFEIFGDSVLPVWSKE
jgi:S1-C subfamily serine protease